MSTSPPNQPPELLATLAELVGEVRALKELKSREVEALELSATRGRTILTADAAALYTGMSKSHLLELARDQQIPHSKRGKFVYFQTENLDKWMAGS